MQLNRKWIISIVLMLVLGVSPVAAQVDDVPDATPTMEVEASPLSPPATQGEVEVPDTTVPVAPESNFGESLFKFFQFAIENQLHWYVFAIIALLVAGNLVPQEEIKRRREQAKATETPIDDVLLAILDGIQTLRGNVTTPPVPIPGEPPIVPPVLLPKGIPLNRNPQLNEAGGGGLRYNEQVIGGRSIAVPLGYAYRGQPSQGSPHCEVHYKFAGGFEFAIAQKAGRFGYAFNIDKFVLAARQRFAIVVEYDAKYAPVVGADGNPTVYLDGSLSEAGRHVTPLAMQKAVNGVGEAQWVIQTAEEYRNLEVVVGLYMPWSSVDDSSTVLVKAIKFVPVADDYGSDVVIRI